jgi:glycosyltransferase involved in cell wall biosynthesis
MSTPRPSKAPDVWHLIAPAPFGGAESVVLALASSRVRAGRATGAMLLAPSGRSVLAERLESTGVAVVRIPVGRRDYGRQAKAVAAIVQRSTGAILHTHGYQGDVVGWRAARSAGVPIVATNHGYVGGDLKNRCYEWVDRWILRRFDAVVAVSDRNAQRLRNTGHPADRLTVVPNGWSPDVTLASSEARRRLGLDNSIRVVGWIGRLSREKGIDLLLESLEECRNCPVCVAIVGEGPERAAAEALVADRDLGHMVKFLGSRSDIASEASAFDVLAISSRTEGLPMAMLEATCAGAALVAFSVGGIPEFLTEDCAWLVPPGDTRQFGRALRQAITDHAEAQRRAAAARQVLASRLNAERWVEEIESVYESARARRR